GRLSAKTLPHATSRLPFAGNIDGEESDEPSSRPVLSPVGSSRVLRRGALGGRQRTACGGELQPTFRRLPSTTNRRRRRQPGHQPQANRGRPKTAKKVSR